MKIIALERIHKTEPGGELDIPENQARVLVLLGKARWAEGGEPTSPKAVKTPRRRRTAPNGSALGAMTKPGAAE